MSHVQRFVLVAIAAAALAQAPALAQEPAEDEGRMIRDPEDDGAYKAGVALLAEEKPREALVQFNRALQGDPTFIEAQIGQGHALQAMEDYGEAINSYSKVFSLTSNPPAEALNGRGEALLELKRIEEAASDFTQALQRDPTNPTILSNLGHVMVNYFREPQGAIRRLDDALAQNDQDARAYRDRGYAHALLQDFAAAEADLKRAAEVNPDDHENFYIMANVYLFQNNFPGAIDAITKSITAYKPKSALDPKQFLSGYLSRADAWLRVGDEETDQTRSETAYMNAIADADAVIAANPDRFPEAGRAHYRKGRALRMLERYSEAVDAFTLALEAIPSGQEVEYVADAYIYRGICWYYIGSHDLARGDFEQASAIGGGFNDPRVFLWIGFTHHQEGDYREAIEAYSEAISKSPNFALAHTNRGRAYMDLKEFTRAIESFNSAIRSEPSVGEHYYNVGFAYAQLEDWLKAEHFLNIALRKANPQPKMYSLMARVLRERGRADLADEYERRANQAQPQQAAGQ